MRRQPASKMILCTLPCYACAGAPSVTRGKAYHSPVKGSLRA